MIPTLYEPFRHWSEKGSVYILSDLHFDDADCKFMSPDWITPQEQIAIINGMVIYKHRDEINDLMRKYSEECLRFAFDAEMSMKKIGEIAQKEIPSIIAKTKNHSLISELLDEDFCKLNFRVYYSILSPVRVKDSKGRDRYYVTPIKVGRKTYYLCSQWCERSRKALLDWIWQNR